MNRTLAQGHSGSITIMESEYRHGPTQPRLQVNAYDEERTPINKRHKYAYEEIGLVLLIAGNNSGMKEARTRRNGACMTITKPK
jgi:hypothetical protein